MKLIDKVKAGNSPAAQYIGKYARLRGSYNYLWDELTSVAWLDPSLITKEENLYLDVNLDRGAGYEILSPGQIRIGPRAMSGRWKCRSTWILAGFISCL